MAEVGCWCVTMESAGKAVSQSVSPAPRPHRTRMGGRNHRPQPTILNGPPRDRTFAESGVCVICPSSFKSCSFLIPAVLL